MRELNYQALRAMRKGCADKLNALDFGMECDEEMNHGYLPDSFYDHYEEMRLAIVGAVASKFSLTGEELLSMAYEAEMREAEIICNKHTS